MTLQRTGRLLLAVLLGLFSHQLIAAEITVNRTADGGQWMERDGIKILSLVGDETALGRQAGELIAPQTKTMLARLAIILPGLPPVPAVDADGSHIDAEYRDEINAWATSANINPAVLMQANLSVSALCTAVVRESDADKHRPLLLARNMDFRPTADLGQRTVVIIRRPTGKHASMAISWPGYVGVVSGMNDSGVSACLLLNKGAKRSAAGEYLGFRLRAILDHADDLTSALALFAAKPTASSNYVMLADATSSAVVWWNGGMMQRVDPTDGWQFCTNDKIDANTGLPMDARAKRAVELSRVRSNPDVDWMKHLLTATYMRDLNAQAMVLVPETRALHLATFDLKAAALSPWHELDGGRLMKGEDLATVPVATSPAITDPLQHYAGAH